MSKIMIVDDEIEIAEMIEDFLRLDGIEVIKVQSGKEALIQLNDDIDLIILDINMKDMKGTEVCKAIRKFSYVPIIFLTCNSKQSDVLLGLGLGADDYMTKPFNPIELVARVKANIRRVKSYLAVDEEVISFGDVVINKKGYRVYRNDVDVHITSTEFKLLLYLISNAFIVLTRNQILNKVWGDDYYDENLVNATIKRLRRKIESNPNEPVFIRTIWGVGYVFEGVVK